MKKWFLLLISVSYLSVNAQTVDEVITKYSAKMGGLAAFNAIKSAKFTGTLTVQGMDLPITITVLNGRGMRTDVEVMSSEVISAYLDGKGWKQNQFAGVPDPTDVDATELGELKAQSSLSSVLMDYKARGHQVVLVGQEDAQGVKAFKINLTNKDDSKLTTYYISTTDYSLLKTVTEREMMGQMANIETYYSDLKELKGAKFYMSRVQKVEGTDIQSVKFDNIELDVPVDEKIFLKP